MAASRHPSSIILICYFDLRLQFHFRRCSLAGTCIQVKSPRVNPRRLPNPEPKAPNISARAEPWMQLFIEPRPRRFGDQGCFEQLAVKARVDSEFGVALQDDV